MAGLREGGCGEVEAEFEVQELENPGQRKFIFSITDLKDLCWVGTLVFNLMGCLMLTWAAAFPRWAQLSYTDRVVFSSLWETCLEGSCWKPGDSAGYLIYGRCFIVFAVAFSFCLNLILLGFFFQLCSPFSQEYLIFATMDTITGITVLIGLLMHMLQIRSFKDKGAKITFLWPFFFILISFILFLYSAILFILIYKEFCHTECLRPARVVPKNPTLEEELVNLEPMESLF